MEPTSRRIAILRDDVSRKIAAGEVIDRPLSIVRELLDNAIDAKASSIEVHLESGGIAGVRVMDDGAGMDAEDLELCWRPHATSKIMTEDDLLSVTSLGFRGEALSSMAVAGRLRIVSATGEPGASAHELEVRGGKLLSLRSCQGRKGTITEVTELFYDFPARKKFLKSPSAESGLCRAVFVDRALAHPGIGFKLFADSALRMFLPPDTGVKRVAAAYPESLGGGLLGAGNAEGSGFSVSVVAGEPSLRRRDRKLLQIFVNRRRVPEYSLVQALEYGFSGYIPGGWYPVAFAFIQVDPSLADFNIHPAKREVRLRNLPEIHAAVVQAVRSRLAGFTRAPGSGASAARVYGVFRGTDGEGRAWPHAARRAPDLPILPRTFTPKSASPVQPSPAAGEAEPGLSGAAPGTASPASSPQAASPTRFLGQVFGVFLVFDAGDSLILLDQHAVHERAIFERLRQRAPETQELLIPLSFDVSPDEAERVEKRRGELASMGIVTQRAGERAFEVTALARDYALVPEAELVEMLRGSAAAGDEWARDLQARTACRLAVKLGDAVDPPAAEELLRFALSLDSPRCPHGRPMLRVITREELFSSVDRPL